MRRTLGVDAECIMGRMGSMASVSHRMGVVSAAAILLALVGALLGAGPAASEDASDWITGLPRQPIHVDSWPGGRKVAVCFIFYVKRSF